jgi:hypothetical protein
MCDQISLGTVSAGGNNLYGRWHRGSDVVDIVGATGGAVVPRLGPDSVTGHSPLFLIIVHYVS